MPAKYTLTVLTDFAAAHTLRDYPGDCSRLHGHNWKLEAEVQATALDKVGMAVDFKVIKRAAREIAGELDHRYLNELEPFVQINPTAEHIAAYLFSRLAERINTDCVRVSAITLWETERACVRYSEEA
ncbi:6-carboxytetrahydropterin synthase QueD [Acidihalobacter yilgarnensis]|uniref:6-carboxy-5,6,7,8-tetrahydropterin synthase n=1 Tax=Acidihalobacter yilgarnensis TaxID=2819280 RepID=A0A1D8IQ47_9GAMM|nr:6-carboxytetrahydropterin synthase QueD [Acidihalobacter yilgarnensis]AOU98582.1 6-carboxytetrahydropterin synthase QueD [Acidihalobacter yilgarnensis]